MRCRFRVLLLIGVACAAGSNAGAQESRVDSLVNACLVRDTAAAWMRAGAQWAAGGTTWSNDSVRNVLLALETKDQAIRQLPGHNDSVFSRTFVQRMAEVDSANLVELQKIVARFGWPGRSLVGAKGASAAFLIAQHNSQYLPEAVRLMKALPRGEVLASELAMMEDRILTTSGQPQRYATQLKPPTGDVIDFYPIDSIGRVDARRAEVGLPPMVVYVCMSEAMSGRKVRYPPR